MDAERRRSLATLDDVADSRWSVREDQGVEYDVCPETRILKKVPPAARDPKYGTTCEISTEAEHGGSTQDSPELANSNTLEYHQRDLARESGQGIGSVIGSGCLSAGLGLHHAVARPA
jgi:hypothetical protein